MLSGSMALEHSSQPLERCWSKFLQNDRFEVAERLGY